MVNFYLLNSHIFQGFYNLLFKILRKLMGYGLGGNLAKNGEKLVIKKILGHLSNPVVFDIGSNKGTYIDAVLGTNSTSLIYAFEPNYDNFEILVKNYSVYNNVKVFNEALGKKNDFTLLFVPKSKDSLASMYKRGIFDAKIDIKEIKVSSLDTFLENSGIDKIDLLKLDVEGHELSILNGAKKILNSGRIANIQFEFGGCNIDSRTYFRDFWDLLNDDFVISKITSTGVWQIKEYSEQLEIFSTINFLAQRKIGK